MTDLEAVELKHPSSKERPILFSAPMILALLAGTKSQTRRVVKSPPKNADSCEHQVNPFVGKHFFRWGLPGAMSPSFFCPYGQPGDRLWCRETWAYNGEGWKNFGPKNQRREGYVTYAADKKRVTHYFPEGPPLASPRQTVPKRNEGDDDFAYENRRARYYKSYFERLRPSIFMPRWASRLTLEVTGVRVERLQDISEADAKAEGFEPYIHESWSAWDPASESTVSLSVEPDAVAIAKHGYEDVRHIGPKVISTAKERFMVLWDSTNGEGAAAKNPWVWAVDFKRLETP